MSVVLYTLGIGLLLYSLFPLAWATLRRRLVAKHTTYYDKDLLGKARPEDAKIRGTAVICGGSYAGLFTARICHDHFERVVIVEPEAWLNTEDARRTDSWEQTSKRSRIEQYSSFQGTQPFILHALSNLFPNLEAECAAANIPIAEWDYQSRRAGKRIIPPLKHYNGILPKCIWASRRALETLVRRLTLDKPAYPNIQQVIGTVTGFRGDAHRLSGVTFRDENGNTQELDAELVIDCSGTSQGGLKWLKRAGFTQEVPKASYDPHVQYSTLQFMIPPALTSKLPIPGGFYKSSGAVYLSTPDTRYDNKYIACVRDEHDSMYVCAGGWGTDIELPRTMDQVIEHVRSLHVVEKIPDWFYEVLEVLREAEDSANVSVVRVGPSYWNRFEETTGLPPNFVALGDAVCRVNPIYGAGCGKALIGATTLNTVLNARKDVGEGFAKQFFQMQAEKIVSTWDGPKINDYSYASTTPQEGEKRESTDRLRWYVQHVSELSTRDEDAALVFYRTMGLIDGAPIDILHPQLVYKVTKQALFG